MHRRRAIFLATAAAIVILVVSTSALNMKIIEVKIETKQSEKPEANKLKIDVIPENLTIGERAKIIVRDSGDDPIEGVKVYVARNHSSSTKGMYIGETNSSGEITHVFEEEGWYKIYAEKEGFFPQATLVNVRLKGSLSFSMKFEKLYDDERLKVMRISSNGRPVERAEVYINGTFVGHTDSNGELSHMFKLGEVYEIVVKKEGYRGLLIILDLDPRGGTGTTIRPLQDV
nr:carboxypeptidase-like regulatory domain-containing protein [Candidatus Baldrarchaeota archaeon]